MLGVKHPSGAVNCYCPTASASLHEPERHFRESDVSDMTPNLKPVQVQHYLFHYQAQEHNFNLGTQPSTSPEYTGKIRSCFHAGRLSR